MSILTLKQRLQSHADYTEQLIHNGFWHQSTALEYISAKSLYCNRPPIDVFSPLPPEKTGVADFCQCLLPFLEAYFMPRLVHPQPKDSDIISSPTTKLLMPEEAQGNWENIKIMNIGNSLYHSWIYDMDFSDSKTIAIFHDTFLGHERYNYLKHQPLRLYTTWHYETGEELMLAAHQSIEDMTSYLINNHPFCKSLLKQIAPKIVIVHSQFSAKIIEDVSEGQYKEGRNLFVLYHPRQRRKINNPRLYPQRNYYLDYPQSLHAKQIVCMGNVTPNKMSKEIVQGFIQSRFYQDGGRLLFVGHCYEDVYTEELRYLIKQHDPYEQISFTGYCDRLTYNQHLSEAFLAIQLRTLTRGESSGTLAECSSYLIPTITNLHGPISEEDSSAFFMLTEIPRPEDITWAIDSLYSQPQLRSLAQSRMYRGNLLHTYNRYAKDLSKICNLLDS